MTIYVHKLDEEMGQDQDDGTWKRVEAYLDWKSSMAMAATSLNAAIRALGQAQFDLVGLGAYPKLDDGTLRSELYDHEDRLTEIRRMLIRMQAELREDAHKDFTGQTDRAEGDE